MGVAATRRNGIARCVGVYLLAGGAGAAVAWRMAPAHPLVLGAVADLVATVVLDRLLAPMVAAVRRLTDRPLDVHLMVTNPLSLVKPFRSAGADRITAHIEAEGDPAATLAAIRASGAKAGLALKPGTRLDQALPLLDRLDLLLVMTVEPGFGGQAFLSDMLDKVREAARLRNADGHRFLIEVDGGIGPETARTCRQAGADVFVAGHALFRASDRAQALADLGAAVGLTLQA